MGNYGFTVIDGDMKYIDPSGAVIDVAEAGSGIMFVNFTVDDSSGANVYSADKTFAEVTAAIGTGKMVFGKYTGDDADFFYMNLSEYNSDSISFRFLILDSDGLFEQFTITITEDAVTAAYVTCDLSTLIVED